MINKLSGKIEQIFHAQYTSENSLVLFECKVCGYTSMSIGRLHAHSETHRGYTRFNIQIPFTKTSPGNFDRLMNLTKVMRVEETKEIDINGVENL